MTYTAESKILSGGQATPAQIDAWFAERGPRMTAYAPDGQYRPAPAELGTIIVEECRRWPGHAVNHDLVAAQISHESAAWQSRYARERNNPSGLGAVNHNPDQAIHFETPRLGVRATVAHLLTYVAGPGPWTEHDPRAAATPAGWQGQVRQLQDLDGKWAWPGRGYGAAIASLANQLLTTEAPMAWDHIIPGLVDIRGKLRTASGPNRGPTERIPMSQKRGVVVHYRGVVTTPKAGYESFAADARYHVDKNWVSSGPPIYGTGIMYHIGIDSEGTGYLMRDLDRVLWHCGAWPQNAEALAIQLPLGGNQQATPAQLRELERIVDAWLAFTNAPRSEVWGHRELGPTDCPGTLMADFVYPYREGPQMADGQWFDVTKHFVGGGFWTYWRDNGGLPVFGYPLTEELQEECEDGVVRTVQYFERAVFEHHPEKQPPYQVLLRRLGDAALKAKQAA